MRCLLLTRLLPIFIVISLTVSAEEKLVSKIDDLVLPEEVTFNAHIRPLMSNTCFLCHGPDDHDNESGFRIDSYDEATALLPSDDALVGIKPGDPEASEVYLRIIGESDGEQMPPEEFRHQLSSYDRALIEKWILQGAKYQQHWSYTPIKSAAVPTPANLREEVANPIDAFVLSRLEEGGIEPVGLADRATLLRRLSLDIIGLPPTPGELSHFLKNESDDAYQQEVDRLLASPHFGERMASGWLDLVRYADTVGFHGDQNQRIFAYRDYVIDAFNNNKPFDEFTREQIAGDLLRGTDSDGPTDEQLTATGLLRLNMMTREGGAQPGEYLAKYKADRVRMLGTAFLGSTLACCECHNHKYDPFTAKDFYSLGAFFDDLKQWGVYTDYGYSPNPDLKGFNNNYPFPPELRLKSPSLHAEIENLQLERDSKLASELGQSTQDLPEYQAWLSGLREFGAGNPDGWLTPGVTPMIESGELKLEALKDRSVLVTGDSKTSQEFWLKTKEKTPLQVSAIRVEVIPDAHHGGHVGRSDDGRFKLSVTASIGGDKEELTNVANRPRYIRVVLPGNGKVLSLAEVQVFSTGDGEGQGEEPKNIAVGGTASQSSDYLSANGLIAVASLAIDGITEGDFNKSKSVTHTKTENNPWWELDLGAEKLVSMIKVFGRTDSGTAGRLKGFHIMLLNQDRKEIKKLTPKTPHPSVAVEVSEEVELSNQTEVPILWAEADRRSPDSYKSGIEPLTLEKEWQSGPARWQLPLGESKLKHTAVYHFSSPVQLAPDDQLSVRFKSGDVGRVRVSLTPIGQPIAGHAAISDNLRHAIIAEDPTEKQVAALVSLFHRSTVPFASQKRTSKFYRDLLLEMRTGLANTMIVQSITPEEYPVSRVLPRGNWQDETGELAPPAVPHFLPQPQLELDSDRRLTRLDLANWITSPENPLTSRHFVNRTWRRFFGSGLSGILNDLGNQGEWPSHPLLMDWLASEFVAGGWDVKQLVRTIVQSRTYRQAAAVRDDLKDVDPYNRLLAQASARRLEAEAIRDNALAISGLLQTNYVGGPSVFPYQPSGHYKNIQFPNRNYVANVDSRQYRRGVYMHWQRSFLHPMLVNFDAPARDECTADRTQSNSPQQALTLLNDPVFVEASHAMAGKLLTQSPDASFSELLDSAFLSAVARPPSFEERATLEGLYQRQLQYFRSHPLDAAKYVSVGNQDDKDHAVRVAALGQVCRVVLNLHETITRY